MKGTNSHSLFRLREKNLCVGFVKKGKQINLHNYANMQCAIRSSLRAMAIRPVAVQPHNGHALLSRIACLNGVNRVHMRCMSALPMIDTDASAVESKLSKESSPVIQIKGRNARKEYTLSRMESVFSSSNMVAVLQHNSLNVAEFAEYVYCFWMFVVL